MAQPRGLFADRKKPSRARGADPWIPDRKASPKAILCVLPRRLRANPLKPLLKGYDLATADNWTASLRLARREPHDLFLVYAPLGWAEAAEVCRKVRAFDPTTPIFVYSTQGSIAERREVMTAGAQAYVSRADNAHNFAGTAGQLIMLAELRSMEAMTGEARAMQDNIVRHLAKLDSEVSGAGATREKVHASLKLKARRRFASAGGTRANFERIWPSIYESALKRGQTEG